MSKHTPGPWTVSEHSWSTVSIYAGKQRQQLVAQLSIEEEATEETQDEMEAEMLANAQLMAESPSLLLALRNLSSEATGFLSMAETKRHGATNCRVLQLRINEAREVIARAGGR